jgi:hypothetical protein
MDVVRNPGKPIELFFLQFNENKPDVIRLSSDKLENTKESVTETNNKISNTLE